jgi:hypothetical protein
MKPEPLIPVNTPLSRALSIEAGGASIPGMMHEHLCEALISSKK